MRGLRCPAEGTTLPLHGCFGAMRRPRCRFLLAGAPLTEVTMLVRANTDCACVMYQFEGDVSAWKIQASVGVGGFNRKEDVLEIQQLLNLIAPDDGGPAPPLAEDGWIGPKTNAAILAFQQFWDTANDNRIDPDGPTLKKMNE